MEENGQETRHGKELHPLQIGQRLGLGVISETIRKLPAKKWIEIYQKLVASRKTPGKQTTKATANTVKKKVAITKKRAQAVRKKST